MQPGEAETVPHANDLANLRRPIHTSEVTNRSLNFRNIVIEHRTHRLKHGFWIRCLRGVALQMFCFGKREFHFTSQCPSEMIAADRHDSNPDVSPVRYKKRRIVRSHVKNHVVVIRSWRFRRFCRLAKSQNIVGEIVVERQWRDLNNFDFLAVVGERLQCVVNQVLLHCEQANFGFEHEAALFNTTTDWLIVPDHVIQVERNLLPRFIADDFSNFAGFDRRQLDELRH